MKGGKRKGSGRKPGPKTKTVSFRIRPEWVDDIKRVVRQEIEKLRGST